MPAVVGPKAGLQVLPEPVYTTRSLNNMPTVEEVILRRKLHVEHEAKIPVWLRKNHRPVDPHPGSHLPPEHRAMETTRAVSRLSSRVGSRKRCRSGGQHPNQHSSQSSAPGQSHSKHPISAPLPYLRPLTGASPPATRERRAPTSAAAMCETSKSSLLGDDASSSMRLGSWQKRLAGTQASSTTSGEATEATDPQVVQQLAFKCHNLMDRLQAVEAELRQVKGQQQQQQEQQFQPQQQQHHTNARPISGKKLGTRESEAHRRHKQALYASVDLTIKDVADQVESLGDVFLETSAIHTRKRWAIGKLMIFIRTIFRRKRQLRYKNALNLWRKAHSQDFIQAMAWQVERHRHICDRSRFMASRRALRVVRDVTAEWQRLTRLHLPRKLRLLQCVEMMLAERKKKLLQVCCQAWWRVSVGPESGRGIRKKHKEQRMKSRQILQSQVADASQGILTPDMIENETRKLIMEEVGKRFHCSILQRHFSAMQQLYSMRRIMYKRACFIDRVKTVRICFYPWREWAYLNAQGIAKKKWKGPGRYEIRYNQFQIDTMARRRLLRYSVQAWRRVIGIYREAHRRYRRHLTRFVGKHFLALHVLAARNMRLRRMAVKNWREYGRDHCEVPFKVWFLFKEKRKRDREARDRLVVTFRRIKIRKLLFKIMRFWRHQALYGRTGALYSRFELIRSLGMQKDHTRSMLEEMQKQEFSVNDMLFMMDEQTAMIQQYEDEAKKKDEEVMTLAMAINHAEQELVRMQSLVECVTTIYPTAALHILKLQPGFNFRDRGLTAVTQFRLEHNRKESVSASSVRQMASSSLHVASSLSTSLDGRNTQSSTSHSSEHRQSSSGVDQGPAASLNNAANNVAISLVIPDRHHWALSATDFRQVLAAGGQKVEGAGDIAGEAAVATSAAGGSGDGGGGNGSDKPLLSVERLYGIFEFMRTGDETALDEADRIRWQQHKATLPAVVASDEAAVTTGSSSNALEEEVGGHSMLLDDEGSSIADMSSTMGSEALLSEGGPSLNSDHRARTTDWPGLTAQAPNAQKRTWADFLIFLQGRVPPKRKTETLEERVLQRIHESKDNAENILKATYQGSNPARDVEIYNDKIKLAIMPPPVRPLDYALPEIPKEVSQDEDEDEEEPEDTAVYHPFEIKDPTSQPQQIPTSPQPVMSGGDPLSMGDMFGGSTMQSLGDEGDGQQEDSTYYSNTYGSSYASTSGFSEREGTEE